MRYPKHLVLDFSCTSFSILKKTWALSYQKTLALPKQKKLFSDRFSKLLTVTHRHFLPLDVSETSNYFPFFFKTNVNFLRKEKIYTKLKYSRCPQYDMVSGGLAALFSAFLGFLICEKFGLELLDSGDFYILLMYIIFAVFSCRPLVKLNSAFYSAPAFYSFKPAIKFYLTIAKLLISFFLNLFTKPLMLNYTCRDFYTWLIEHQYVWTLVNSIRFWIKFLKNYPRDDIMFGDAYRVWGPFLEAYWSSNQSFDEVYWAMIKQK